MFPEYRRLNTEYSFAFFISVEKANPAYPELILKKSEAPFQLICNVSGLGGRGVNVTRCHEEVTSYAALPPFPIDCYTYDS